MSTIEERVRDLFPWIEWRSGGDAILTLAQSIDALDKHAEIRLDALEKSTGELERDTATVTRNLKERIDRLEQNVKAELLAARERVEQLEKYLGIVA